jgi:hypothetical protein
MYEITIFRFAISVLYIHMGVLTLVYFRLNIINLVVLFISNPYQVALIRRQHQRVRHYYQQPKQRQL